MARPRKSDHTRQQLIDAGIDLLIKQGYHGTGIKAVLDQVGVPKGSFYNFFASKEAFVATIIEHYGELESEEMLARISHLDSEPALVQLWCAFAFKVNERVQQQQSCACLLGVMSAEMAEASDLCREIIQSVGDNWRIQIAALINQAQGQGDLRSDISAEAMSTLLYNSWQGCLLHYQLSQNPQTLLDHLWTLMTSLLTPQGLETFNHSNHCSRDIHYD